MRLLHLTFGLFIVVVFLLTGLYMHFHLHHMAGVPDALRLLYRTRHIFILLAGLLNLVLAAYLVDRSGRSRRVFQWLGSILIIIASLLFVAAFFYDSTRGDLRTPLSHWGVYAIAVGTLVHLLCSAGGRKMLAPANEE